MMITGMEISMVLDPVPFYLGMLIGGALFGFGFMAGSIVCAWASSWIIDRWMK